jgi:hypothetical protein
MSSTPEINFNFLKKSSKPPNFEKVYVYRLNTVIEINKPNLYVFFIILAARHWLEIFFMFSMYKQ